MTYGDAETCLRHASMYLMMHMREYNNSRQEIYALRDALVILKLSEDKLSWEMAHL